jgi:hypothetical protein
MADPTLALGAQAIGWAVMLPLLSRLAVRFNGIDPVPTAAFPQATQEARSHV